MSDEFTVTEKIAMNAAEPSAEVRATRMCGIISYLEGERARAVEVRDQAFRELHADGSSVRVMATKFGVSKSRIAQIVGVGSAEQQ